MASLSSFFTFGKVSACDSDLPVCFPMPIACVPFIAMDIINLWTKILTDVIERTAGIPEKYKKSLWDNCVQSEASKGLVSLISDSMAYKSDLYLVYNADVLRRADTKEQQIIREDYIQKGSSPVGVYVSFRNFEKTTILELYSAMEYNVIASLFKSMNLAKAIQYKMADMRTSVGASDSDTIIAQAKAMARALSNGRDVLMDGKDEIVTSTPETDATAKAMQFIDGKRSFYLGLPASYINGEQTGGIGSTGEGDTRAIERGLRHYFVSIIDPVLLALWGLKTKFKSQDFRMISAALETIKTFELVSDDLISLDDKRAIVAALLDTEPVTGSTESIVQTIQPNQLPAGTV